MIAGEELTKLCVQFVAGTRVQRSAQRDLRAEQAESMPLHGTVGQLLNRLIAAGVGQRPVIFVTHRSAPAPHTCTLESGFEACVQSHAASVSA